ncbi:uncharacterized protein BXZ73DRAFT_80144 [Epithele typhae]|uniref:uncharacterized protein n=1 Tax=Epithele typhae TaxID=378194 RepID=UPI00200757C7|nr:uncharacterized protein BXZ73DRAFT_80144 [Epithele typhae]KAH9920574.1 hypothetical protein BXZ73DRAFT_80144 [Epithele typhae]
MVDGYAENEPVYFPPTFPLTATLANRPILDAARNSLFHSLPIGHHLTAARDKELEIRLKGNGLVFRARLPDNHVTTILVTLPIKFGDGSLLVGGVEGREEKLYGRGPRVDRTHRWLRKIAFYDTADYCINPGEVVADKSRSRWCPASEDLQAHAGAALDRGRPRGGYIWPVDQTVEMTHENAELAPATESASTPTSMSTTASRSAPDPSSLHRCYICRCRCRRSRLSSSSARDSLEPPRTKLRALLAPGLCA